MHHFTTNTDRGGDAAMEAPRVLSALRSLMPNRELTLFEALRVAELQADRLLTSIAPGDIPVPSMIVTDLPRIVIKPDPDLPGKAASGCTSWDSHRGRWVISLNPDEPEVRQRFTVFHEFKHILDHYSQGIRPTATKRPAEELVADYFAGCTLMPKRILRSAYFDGIQRTAELAELFEVSESAILVRLSQLGLGEPEQPVTAPRYRLQRDCRRTAEHAGSRALVEARR